MAAVTEEAVSLDVDLDAIVPCQTRTEDCPIPADWATHLACCGHRHTICEKHRADGHRRWHEAEDAWGGVICALCGTDPMPHPTWRPL